MSATFDPNKSTTESDPRWSRVIARDAAADRTFVYAVRTTGVYCRPSCPSRTAKPRNVRFFSTPAEAEGAGYRACLRCRPKGRSPGDLVAGMVTVACRLMEEADDTPRLAVLAAAVGLSPSHLRRRFHALTGLTPKAYGASQRAKKVRVGLAEGGTAVTQAIYAAGFNSSSRFYEKSDALLGMTPTAYKRGAQGVEIRYALGRCSLGTVLVACSLKGVCAVTLGDDPATLVRDLRDRFPGACLIDGDVGFAQLAVRAIRRAELPAAGSLLPFDIRRTVVQQRAWQALREFPFGAGGHLQVPRRATAVGA